MWRLIPAGLQEKIIKNGKDMLKEQQEDPPPMVKLLSIVGSAMWLLSELNPMEPTVAFSLCDLGRGFPELDYVSLEELESIKHLSSPIPLIVRDEHFEADDLMSVYVKAASQYQSITENPMHLQQAHQKIICQQVKSSFILS